MPAYNKAATRRNSSQSLPLQPIGSIPLGSGANLTLRLGNQGGARVLDMRNFLRGREGMLPAGGGCIVGADRIPELIAILQRAEMAS